MSIKPEIITGAELTLDTFITGAKALLPETAHLLVDGKLYSPAELIAVVEDARAPYKAKRTAKTELQKASTDLVAKQPAIDRFVKALHTGTKAYLGEDNPELVKFGFKPNKKPRALTGEAAVQRAEKMRATRQKNHTMGKHQKEVFDAAPPAAEPQNGNGSSGSSVAGGASHVA